VNDFEDACRELPPMSFEEKLVICDFVLMAVLWFFRDPKGAWLCVASPRVCVRVLCVTALDPLPTTPQSPHTQRKLTRRVPPGGVNTSPN
jgi:di/tricarboxylate transporter